MHKLGTDELKVVEDLLKPLDIHLAVKSVIDANTPGMIFVDDREQPKSAFVWARNRLFLAGKSNNEEFNNSVKNLFDETIYPESQMIGVGGYSLFYSPDDWGDSVKSEILAGKYPLEDTRLHFRFKQFRHNWQQIIPDGFSVHAVNKELLNDKTLGNLDTLMEEMQSERPTVIDFLEKSFGYCVIYEGELVAWCLSEYNRKDSCEVGIETLGRFKRKGLAIITCSALIEHALITGITNIGWHCFSRNNASIATAKSIGFEIVHEYPSFWGVFDKGINLAVNGNLHLERKEYHEATDWYHKAIDFGEVPGWVFWNTACAFAYLDQLDTSFEYLNQAVDRGFNDPAYIQESIHFKKWNHTKEWKELLDKVAVD
jgi:RimJ/RimL family protein N-acetyltransferase